MAQPIRILIIEDRASDAELMIREVKRTGLLLEWRRVDTEESFLAELESPIDVILSDYSLPHFDGVRALNLLRERGLDIPFILVTGTLGEESLADLMKQGVGDYVLKDRPGRLGSAVQRALQEKRLRDENQKAEEQLRIQASALEAAADAVVITNPRGVIEWANPSFTRMTGYALEEVKGRHTRILKSGFHEESHYRDMWETILAGRVWEGELVNRRKDGSFYTEHMTITPLRGAGDGISHFIAIKQDITERKRSEKELRSAHAQLHQMLAHSQAVLYTLQFEGDRPVPHFISENIARLFGYEVEEALRRDWWLKNLHPDDKGRALSQFSEVLKYGRTSMEYEYRFRHRDGSWHWVSDNQHILYDQEGGPKEVVGVWTDVTERRLLEESRRESEERYRRLVEVSPDAVLVNRDDRITFINEAGLRLFGARRPEDILGKSQFDLYDPVFHEAIRLRMAKVRRTGKPVPLMEQRIVRLDGRKRDVEVAATPFHESGHTVIQVILHDITARKRTQTALAQRTQSAMLSAEIGVALTRQGSVQTVLQNCAEAVVRHLNAAFARIWTLNSDEDVLQLKASAGMYVHLDGPHGKVRVGEKKIGMIAKERKPHLTNSVIGDPCVSEQEWARLEGMVSFAGYPLLVEDRLVGVLAMFAKHRLSRATLSALGSVADAVALGVERKRTEASLLEYQRRTELLLQSATEGIVGVDLEGRCALINRAGAAMLGWTTEDIMGRDLHDVSHHHSSDGASYPNERCPINRVVKTGVACRLDTEVFWRRDGTSFPVEYSASPVIEDGTIKGAVVTFADITERVQLEEQYRHSQKMEAFGQLAGGVAHDFNNILGAILLQVDLTQDTPGLPGDIRDELQEIRYAAEQAANLTQQLLLFGRRQVMQMKVLDLNEIVTNLAKMLRRIIGEDVRLQLNLHSRPLMTRADAVMLDQILLNLSVNARDAMPDGGQLLIETMAVEVGDDQLTNRPEAVAGPYVGLSVSDTGEGMSPETLSRAFEPFFTTKEQGKGTGLGLATVFSIVQQHQGWVDVESEPGRRTIFRVYLPATDAKPDSAGKSNEPPRGGAEVILVVEDDWSVRELTAKLLRRHGYKVLEASTGAEALEVWEKHRDVIAMLLTDLVMPGGMSGRELGMRLLAAKQGLKILYFSGYSAEYAGRELDLRSGENFMQKPVHKDELLKMVRESLDG